MEIELNIFSLNKNVDAALFYGIQAGFTIVKKSDRQNGRVLTAAADG
jgi:hypothetical protein